MEYRIIRSEDHLEHHGILGQKWGIRRYQNPDGTLTDAGRKRLYKSIKKDHRKNRSMMDAYDVNDETASKIKNLIDEDVVKTYRDANRKVAEYTDNFYNNKEMVQKNLVQAFKKEAPFGFEYSELNEFVGLPDSEIKKLWYDGQAKSLAFNYHAKNSKEYQRLEKESKEAFQSFIKMQEKIADELLGQYGDEKIRVCKKSHTPYYAKAKDIVEHNVARESFKLYFDGQR